MSKRNTVIRQTRQYNEYNPSEKYEIIPEYPFIKEITFKDLLSRSNKKRCNNEPEKSKASQKRIRGN